MQINRSTSAMKRINPNHLVDYMQSTMKLIKIDANTQSIKKYKAANALIQQKAGASHQHVFQLIKEKVGLTATA